MSEPTTEPTTPEAIELPPQGDASFAQLMDTLVADEASKDPAAPATPGSGDPGTGAGAVAGEAGAAGEPAGTPDGTGAAATAAAPGTEGAPAGGAKQPPAANGAADATGVGLVDAATLIPQLGKLTQNLEETTFRALQEEALAEVRGENEKYFKALETHPRLLVGTEVPAIGKEGTEKLKDSSDAAEWQEAVKQLLIEEVRERARKGLDEKADFMATMHQSIALFQNNVDLIPNTTGFNKELADRFAVLAKPYELRVDEKLQGYSIPVQPLIDTVRAQLKAEKAAATTAPAPSVAAGTDTNPVDPPQAGITSKAGAGDSAEDFSTLFGTIGLPNLRI